MTAQIVSLATYRTARGQRGASAEWHTGQDKLLSERRQRPRQGELGADRRSECRYSVDGRCAPTVVLGASIVGLANVSRGGLMINSELQVRPGARLLVTLAGGRPVSARLIWKRNGLAGLEAPIISTVLDSI